MKQTTELLLFWLLLSLVSACQPEQKHVEGGRVEQHYIEQSHIEQSDVPLGEWKDEKLSRYMIIEPNLQAPHEYKVTLFSQKHSGEQSEDQSTHQSKLSRKRHVSATMKDGVLMLKTAGADIPVLYHPSRALIQINGQSTFRRVSLSDAPIPIRDHHSGVERSGVY